MNDLETIVKQVISDYPSEYRGLVEGDKVYMAILIGHVLKRTEGMADPRAVHMLIREQWKDLGGKNE